MRFEYATKSGGCVLAAQGIYEKRVHFLRARQFQALYRAQDEDRFGQDDTLFGIVREHADRGRRGSGPACTRVNDMVITDSVHDPETLIVTGGNQRLTG